VTYEVAPGSAVVVIGANGAGKSTLLRLLAGKHLPEDRESVLVLGAPPFFQTLGHGISFLGNSMWTRSVAFVGSAVVYEADIAAGDLLKEQQEVTYRERRDELVALLQVDLTWRMHQVSDGQRRRVQLMLGLMAPYQVLLMDEVTVDLDVLVRADLLAYLKKDCKQRNATVLYATHIFDGLDGWPTHLMYMCDGKVVKLEPPPMDMRLHEHVVAHLRQERATRPAQAETQRPEVGFGSASGYVAGRNLGLGLGRMAAYR
jgi:CCR4-NOT complex subunit CAF16